MFKRLTAWLRAKRTKVFPPKTATVYGVRTTGPRGLCERVALREVPVSSVVRKPEFPAPAPKTLKRLGPTDEEHKANGRKWAVEHTPDVCLFL